MLGVDNRTRGPIRDRATLELLSDSRRSRLFAPVFERPDILTCEVIVRL